MAEGVISTLSYTCLEDKATALDRFIIRLYEIGGVKFGSFKLKSGSLSPVYFDLRVIISYPDVMVEVCDILWDVVVKNTRVTQHQRLCGVPYTALPLATVISVKNNLPMLIRRKEVKDYGTKKMVEGVYCAGDTCLIVEDVITTGTSIMETVQDLSDVSVRVTDTVVLLDRQQGGVRRLKERGIDVHSVCSLTYVLDVLHKAGKLETGMVQQVSKFISDNSYPPEEAPTPSTIVPLSRDNCCTGTSHSEVAGECSWTPMTFADRATMCTHPVSRRLFSVMDRKCTNIILSADLTHASQLLEVVDQVGKYVCAVKTHVDIVDDFSPHFVADLRSLAEKHDFVIIEDRKFADIGHTVMAQYTGGVHRISEWADVVTIHALPGDGVIKGLKQAVAGTAKGCLLVAEMSCHGNLATAGYTKAAVAMARSHGDFVIGFICQTKLSDDPTHLHMTPGVRLSGGQDDLGQGYLTPHQVIADRLSDAIVVGRGIFNADDPVAMAMRYRDAAYSAYRSRFAAVS